LSDPPEGKQVSAECALSPRHCTKRLSAAWGGGFHRSKKRQLAKLRRRRTLKSVDWAYGPSHKKCDSELLANTTKQGVSGLALSLFFRTGHACVHRSHRPKRLTRILQGAKKAFANGEKDGFTLGPGEQRLISDLGFRISDWFDFRNAHRRRPAKPGGACPASPRRFS
jgi:hypothetical protein